jgi:hypothetical protein
MAAKDKRRQRAVSVISAATRWGGPDDPRLPELYQELHALELEEHLRRLVNAAPPLSDEQRGRLAALLFAPPPAPAEGDSGAANGEAA